MYYISVTVLHELLVMEYFDELLLNRSGFLLGGGKHLPPQALEFFDSESIQVFLNQILKYIARHKMLTIVKSKYVCS